MFPTHETAPAIPAKSWLDALLHEAGRDGQWLAEQLGIDSGTVSRYRNGLRPQDRERRERIAGVLAEELGRPINAEEVFR